MVSSAGGRPKTPWNISQCSLDGMPTRTALVMTACAERYKQGRAVWESTAEIPFASFFFLQQEVDMDLHQIQTLRFISPSASSITKTNTQLIATCFCGP